MLSKKQTLSKEEIKYQFSIVVLKLGSQEKIRTQKKKKKKKGIF